MDPLQEYTYTNYSHPWYQDRQRWMWILGGVVAVLLVVGGSVWFVRHRNAVRLQAAEQAMALAGVRSQLASGLAECELASDVEACKQSLTSDVATTQGDVSLCDTLSGVALFGCARDLAVTQMSKEPCKILNEETNRQGCMDRVQSAVARRDHDYRACGDIQDETIRTSCESVLRLLVVANGECRAYGLDQALCENFTFKEEARAAGDVNLCDKIADPSAADDCRGAVRESDADQDGVAWARGVEAGTDPTKADTDGDGLQDNEELRYHWDPLSADQDKDGLPDGEEIKIWMTDITKADTDGDGYTDGAEVQNGYNPRGAGSLSSPSSGQ